MPFIPQIPKLFTKQNVESLNPNQFGIYGIFRQNQWIYVGKGDIRKRLLDHLNRDIPCIMNTGPTHWVDEVLSEPQMSIREKQLITELNPSCNQKLG